jgi:truncated hemoglobin YjbI
MSPSTRRSADRVLEPLFRNMPQAHFQHLAQFIAEVLGGGPAEDSARHGGHAAMIRQHLGKGITERQRQHWVLLLETADEFAPLRPPGTGASPGGPLATRPTKS